MKDLVCWWSHNSDVLIGQGMDIYWEQWKDDDQFVDEDLSYASFVL